jgi:hypothetical protein
MLCGQARAAFNFNSSFSGTPPSTPTPWMTATLSQIAANEVEVTISLPSTLPSGTFLSQFYLNFNPALTADLPSLTATPVASTIAFSSFGHAEDAFMADGDGLYDINLGFPTAGSGSRLAAGDTASLIITDPNHNITPNSFLFTSTMGGGNGTWMMAGHLQGYGNGLGSWVAVAIPESNFALGSSLVLLVAAGSRLWKQRALSRQA